MILAEPPIRFFPPSSNVIDQSDGPLTNRSSDADYLDSVMSLGGISGQRADEVKAKRGFPFPSGSRQHYVPKRSIGDWEAVEDKPLRWMIEGELWNAKVGGKVTNLLGLHGLVIGNGAVGSQQSDPFFSFGKC